MNDEITRCIAEIEYIVRETWPSHADRATVYRNLVSLARISGYKETYDDDLNGMRVIARLLGEEQGLRLVALIPLKLGSSEWYEYAAEIMVENDSYFAQKGLQDLMKTNNRSYLDAVQRVIKRKAK